MMGSNRDDHEGYQSVEKPVRPLLIRTAVAISLVTGGLLIPILYFKGE
jgi:hypothetical protein